MDGKLSQAVGMSPEWIKHADASGWATAPVKIVVPLAAGEKRTILILDTPGGGVHVEVI